jgi:magnesium transporter
VAAVPTLVAGIFGMNFSRIPGASESWGFGAVIALMVVIAAGVHRLLRRSGWL